MVNFHFSIDAKSPSARSASAISRVHRGECDGDGDGFFIGGKTGKE
jgi:hypothetical protein